LYILLLKEREERKELKDPEDVLEGAFQGCHVLPLQALAGITARPFFAVK